MDDLKDDLNRMRSKVETACGDLAMVLGNLRSDKLPDEGREVQWRLEHARRRLSETIHLMRSARRLRRL